MTQQGYNSYNYSYVFGQDPYKRKNHITTSPKELKHIGIAAALVIGIGFSMGFGTSFSWSWTSYGCFCSRYDSVFSDSRNRSQSHGTAGRNVG